MHIGRTIRAIAEGYIPAWSHGPGREIISHEAACVLDTNDAEAHVAICFADKDTVGPYRVTVPARRNLHLRVRDLTDPGPIPLGADYSSVFISDLPIVVQHTWLDSRQDANALLSTIAYAQ